MSMIFAVPERDKHRNRIAQEGIDICPCGCKYWEYDRCIDCGTNILEVI